MDLAPLVNAEEAMQKHDSEHIPQQQRQGGRPQAPREGNGADQPGQEQGIEPRRPETMPRAEDDATTFARSPEFHDRVPKRD
jgi:hypothetical protein